MTSTEAAVGVRPHSGWAVVVAITRVGGGVQVLDRRRVPLLDGEVPRQPYHAAESLDLAAAARLVAEVERSATVAAAAALEEVDRALTASGASVTAVGVVGEPRTLPELERILTSHALLHSAEGDLYREAVANAAAAKGRTVVCVHPKALALTEEETTQLKAEGRRLGPPWQKDHREAATVALTALRV